jgi:hypothetical protein
VPTLVVAFLGAAIAHAGEPGERADRSIDLSCRPRVRRGACRAAFSLLNQRVASTRMRGNLGLFFAC